MAFPHDDKAWAETAGFLQAQLKPADRVLAPDLFRWVVPRAQRFMAARSATPRDFEWVVTHKGEMAALPRPFLEALAKQSVAVFANPVFVVWASAPPRGLKDLADSDHVRAFHVNLESLPATPPPPPSRPQPAAVAASPAPAPRSVVAVTELPEVPARPWLAPGGLPGAGRERAFQQEIDRLTAEMFHGGAGLSLLDIGCGSGRLGPVLPAARAVTGIDIDPMALDRAVARHAERPGFDFVRMDATRLGFADASFDGALMLDGADAFTDLPAVLAEAARTLASGGRLMLTAPNRDSLALRALRRLGLPIPGRCFGVQQLTGMLRAAGLTVIRSEGLFLSPGWALPGAGGALGPLEEDPEFIEAARLLGARIGPDYALAFVLLARKG